MATLLPAAVQHSTKVADALFSSSWRMLVVQFCPSESDARARRPAHFATWDAVRE